LIADVYQVLDRRCLHRTWIMDDISCFIQQVCRDVSLALYRHLENLWNYFFCFFLRF